MANDLEFNIDLSGLDDHFKQIKRAEKRLNDLSPAMELVGKYMLRRVYRGFKEQSNPYGEPWAPITLMAALSRVKNKKKIGQPLIDTGDLRRSFNTHFTEDSVSVGSPNEYAEIHQYGLMNEMGFPVPQRMMIPTSDVGLPEIWRRKALRELTNHVLKDDI